MKVKGTLNDYLYDINAQATEMLKNIMKRMAETEGVNEALKEKAQMLWVGKMNAIKHDAEEIVLHNIIYT